MNVNIARTLNILWMSRHYGIQAMPINPQLIVFDLKGQGTHQANSDTAQMSSLILKRDEWRSTLPSSPLTGGGHMLIYPWMAVNKKNIIFYWAELNYP